MIPLSAIAQNQLFVQEVAQKYQVQKSFCFRDHHNFSLTELQNIVDFSIDKKLPVVTTEKDFMRLSQPEFSDLITKMSIFVIPIKVQFLAKEGEFLALVEEGMVSAGEQRIKF